jgi:hypothetical protein
MAFAKRAREVYREEGVTELGIRACRTAYERALRPHLPRRTGTYNGVEVPAARLLDELVPGYSSTIPGYEQALVEGLHRRVDGGDTVVIVGGGWGVTAVHAARLVGADGSVHVYEAAALLAAELPATLERHGVSDRVTVDHAIVSPAVDLYADAGDATVVDPESLPRCDVLELDCEGAERRVLSNMEIRPETVLVETHGTLGSPTAAVRDQLRSIDYEVVSETVAEERVRYICEREDTYVLEALDGAA